jgi:hypothetical protein
MVRMVRVMRAVLPVSNRGESDRVPLGTSSSFLKSSSSHLLLLAFFTSGSAAGEGVQAEHSGAVGEFTSVAVSTVLAGGRLHVVQLVVWSVHGHNCLQPGSDSVSVRGIEQIRQMYSWWMARGSGKGG